MYAVTAGSENSVNSVETSDAATSRIVVRLPRSGGTRSVHRLSIDYRILADGRRRRNCAGSEFVVQGALKSLSQSDGIPVRHINCVGRINESGESRPWVNADEVGAQD